MKKFLICSSVLILIFSMFIPSIITLADEVDDVDSSEITESEESSITEEDSEVSIPDETNDSNDSDIDISESIDKNTEVETSTEDVGTADIDNDTSDYLYDFLNRLYSLVLNRDPDDDGISYWFNKIISGEDNGANVGYGFVFSKEYIENDVSDEDFVLMLYKVFLNREGDEAGIIDWVAKLQKGYSRQYVFSGFVNSQEYQGICKYYGIEVGNYVSNQYQDKDLGTTQFIIRLYKVILERNYDSVGLNDWCKKVSNKSVTLTEVAFSFVNSKEFINKNLSDAEYIKILYKAFLGREAEDAGLNYWLNEMENGLTRNDLLNGFGDSVEFKNIIGAFTGVYNGVKMPTSTNVYNSWIDSVKESRNLNIDVDDYRSKIVELCEIWTQKGAKYKFGGKVIQSGYIDCSGYVTYLVRRYLNTISDTTMSYGNSSYQNYFEGLQDTTYRGVWNDYVSYEYPMLEGYYSIKSTSKLKFYVDKYGIGSPNLMDTREWEYYFKTFNVSSTKVTINQLKQMPLWHYGEERPNSFTWDWIDNYHAGDIIIWFDGRNNSEHIGIYDGQGGVYHSSSFDYINLTENNLGIQHSDLRSIGASTPKTVLSYFIIYHMS